MDAPSVYVNASLTFDILHHGNGDILAVWKVKICKDGASLKHFCDEVTKTIENWVVFQQWLEKHLSSEDAVFDAWVWEKL